MLQQKNTVKFHLFISWVFKQGFTDKAYGVRGGPMGMLAQKHEDFFLKINSFTTLILTNFLAICSPKQH